MRTKLILIVLFFLVIFLQVRSKEFFTYLDFRDKKSNCDATTKILNDVNYYKSEVCIEDDSNPNNVVNNERLNCRQFEENNIFLSKDRESWCKGLDFVPNLKINTDPKTFDGIDRLQKIEGDPKPIIDEDKDQEDFPFKNPKLKFINLDNRNKK
jgi:hypothetical protein